MREDNFKVYGYAETRRGDAENRRGFFSPRFLYVSMRNHIPFVFVQQTINFNTDLQKIFFNKYFADIKILNYFAEKYRLTRNLVFIKILC